jgi:hypothetical protein
MSSSVRDYLIAVIAATIGLYLGGLAGALLGSVLAPDGGLEALGPVVVGLLAGGLLGAPLACWLALAVAGSDLAGRTALFLPVTMVILVILDAVLLGNGTRVNGLSPALLAVVGALLARLVAGYTSPTIPG